MQRVPLDPVHGRGIPDRQCYWGEVTVSYCKEFYVLWWRGLTTDRHHVVVQKMLEPLLSHLWFVRVFEKTATSVHVRWEQSCLTVKEAFAVGRQCLQAAETVARLTGQRKRLGARFVV